VLDAQRNVQRGAGGSPQLPPSHALDPPQVRPKAAYAPQPIGGPQ
jgi:hypothetical protein